MFKISPYKCIGKNFLFYFLSLKDVQKYIAGSSTGSAMPAIKHSTIGKIKFVSPNEELVKSFEKTCEKIECQIVINNNQKSLIKNVRDNLLPKLMSGEIRVPLDSEGETS